MASSGQRPLHATVLKKVARCGQTLVKDCEAWCLIVDLLRGEKSAGNSGQASQGSQYLSLEERFILKAGKGYSMPASILRPVDDWQLGLGPKHLGK